MTENYIVFVEQPFKFEMKRYPKLLLQGKPINKLFSWNPEENVSYFIYFIAPLCTFHECIFVPHTDKVLCC